MPAIDNLVNIIELTRDELVAWLADHKIAGYRAEQIQKWIYLRQADSFEVMTDLSKEIRRLLPQYFMIGRLEAEQIETSRDGPYSRKGSLYPLCIKPGGLCSGVPFLPNRSGRFRTESYPG
jgi:adenine C2-methylase RlmN of 23S rRNA A2503 and tRNA A37